MSICPNSEEQYVAAAGTAMGMGGAVNDLSATSNPVKEQLEGNVAVAQRDAYIREKINQIRDSIGRDATPGVKATGKDKAALRGAAKRTAKWYEESERSWRNRWANEWSAAYRKATDTGVGKASKWLDITTNMAKRFLHSGAWFDKWATLWAQQNDRAHLDNNLIQAFHSMPLKIQAVRQQWTQHTDELLKLARPAAKRLGYSDEDMAHVLGEYAMARHVPEANAHLLKSWADSLDMELRKPLKEQDQILISKLLSKIESLQQNIDNAAPDKGAWSCGFTNAQARNKIDEILKLGITREEAEAFSNKLVELNRIILQARIDKGLVRPEAMAKFPMFESYVPIHTERWNLEGIPNDVRGYNPGQYHKSEGMQSYMDAPDNAFKSTLYYANRAANEIGMHEFGTLMAATAIAHKSMGRDSGLRISSRESLRAMQQKATDPALRQWARNFEETGGIVIDAPVRKKDGSVSIESMIVYFDHKFQDNKLTGLTGAQLNQSLTAAPRVSSAMNKIATATSIYGQMHTRAQPPFAVVNSIRDIIERSFHLAASTMFNGNGQHVSGIGLLPRYFMNAGRSTFMLAKAMLGKADGTAAGTYWSEYTGFGLRQQYTEGMSGQHKTLADMINGETSTSASVVERALNDPRYKNMKNMFYNLGRAGKAGLRTLDGWNDYFNNIASFNHYVTLREAGVSPQDAASKVMQSMNLQQSGDYTPVLRMMYPFTKTTLQSATAMMRSLGFAYDPRGFFHAGKKGWAYMAGTTIALMSLRPLIDEWLGEDENGNRRMDNMRLGDLARYLPIGYNKAGDFIKLPLGYGPIQAAATFAFGWDRVERGLMTPEDFASELLFTWVKNTTPGNWPAYDMSLDPMDYLIQAFSPTLLDPIIELATDRTYFGEVLSNSNRQPFESAAGAGKLSTPREYHQMAVAILKATGIDLTPEQVEAFESGVLIGPLRLLQSLRRSTGVWEEDPVYKRGAELSTKDRMNPYLAAMGFTQLWGTSSNVGRGMFYQAMDYYAKRVKEAGVKLTSSNKDDYGTNDKEAKRVFQENQLADAGFTSDEIDDIIMLYETRGKVGALNKDFSQESKRLWLQAETSDEFRAAFDDLANQEAELYNDVVNELNYYRESR